jgi:hypothetical protein
VLVDVDVLVCVLVETRVLAQSLSRRRLCRTHLSP